MDNAKLPPAGMEGMVVGDTSICRIDEKAVKLSYRGYLIDELVTNSTFEEVAFLLLTGELPCPSEYSDFCNTISKEMTIPKEVETVLMDLPKGVDPMDALKIAVGALGIFDADASNNSKDANMKKAVRLISKIPVLITAQYRIAGNKEIIPPIKEGGSIAKNFLYMLKGVEPAAEEISAVDKSLILYAEHGYNASTFAARITASTLSDIHSAVVTAISTLKGSLHGGANERAMEMILDIGSPENTEAWLMNALNEKRKIMGFGHRVYKTSDPRNRYIKDISLRLSKRSGNMKWFDISRKAEEVMDREKGLHPNLDFYASSVYYLLGIPIPLYTPLFAASRVAGWAANIIEQHENNRLIRPKGRYAGYEQRDYIPLSKRVKQGHS